MEVKGKGESGKSKVRTSPFPLSTLPSPLPLRVLLGVTGGIAAYKALELARLFRKAGWDVQAVMTESARKFVGPESFRALTHNPVATELFPKTRPASDRSDRSDVSDCPTRRRTC
jgi:phosphopantothenoylcysteine synthetase/decarboxylase